MSLDRAQIIVRAFTTFFHLANLSEENYRVETLRKRESRVSIDSAVDPVNELTVAYRQMIDEVGEDKANELLARLEFHPVFTAHPTEARRKAVEGKIRRISRLLAERRWAIPDLMENRRHLLQEIDALLRTSPVAPKEATPVEEADTIIDIFDNTLFDTIPMVYRRFDDWILGDKAGLPAFFHRVAGLHRPRQQPQRYRQGEPSGCRQIRYAHGVHPCQQVPPRGPQPHP